jgi:hypothetical protein
MAGQWLEVLRLMVSPGITDESAPCFVAWDLKQGRADPDPQEDLAIHRLPFQEAVASRCTPEQLRAACQPI